MVINVETRGIAPQMWHNGMSAINANLETGGIAPQSNSVGRHT